MTKKLILLCGSSLILLVFCMSFISSASLVLYPTGAGDSTALTPNTGTNFGAVDELVADNAVTYVSSGSSTSYIRDLYALYNTPTTGRPGTINSVKVYGICSQHIWFGSGYTAYIQMGVKSGSTESWGSATFITTNDVWSTVPGATLTEDPDTSAAWTWDSIDSLQAGVQSKTNSALAEPRCTQVWVVVDYDLPTGEILRPDGDDTVQLGSTDTTHFTEVDETPADTADFIGQYQDNTYKYDLFTMADSGVGAGTINSVTVVGYNDAGWLGYTTWGYTKFTVVGDAYAGIDQYMRVAGYYSQTWDKNPDTSSEWTWDDIDNLKSGVYLKAGGTTSWWTASYQDYVIVNWTRINNVSIINTSRIYSLTNTTADDLYGYCNATDSNNDNLTYSWKWFRDDLLYSEGAFTNYTGLLSYQSFKINQATLDYPNDLKVINDIAYIVSLDSHTFLLMNVTNKKNMFLISNLTNISSLHGVNTLDVYGDYAYVTSYLNDSLVIINITNKSKPEQIGVFFNSTSLVGANSIDVKGDYAYISSTDVDRLLIINVTDKNNPEQVGELLDGVNLDWIQDTYIQGDYAYIASLESDSFSVVNITDVTAPTLVGTFTNTSLDGAVYVTVRGNYAYVSGLFINSTVIMDVTDKNNPAQVGIYNHTNIGRAWGNYLAGNYLYVTGNGKNSLSVLDVSDVTNPTLTASINTGESYSSGYLNGANKVFVEGKYAYVIAHHNDSISSFIVGNGTAQGLELQVANITGNELTLGEEWILSCQSYDDVWYSNWTNSSLVTIIAGAGLPECTCPGAGDFIITEDCILSADCDIDVNDFRITGGNFYLTNGAILTCERFFKNKDYGFFMTKGTKVVIHGI